MFSRELDDSVSNNNNADSLKRLRIPKKLTPVNIAQSMRKSFKVRRPSVFSSPFLSSSSSSTTSSTMYLTTSDDGRVSEVICSEPPDSVNPLESCQNAANSAGISRLSVTQEAESGEPKTRTTNSKFLSPPSDMEIKQKYFDLLDDLIENQAIKEKLRQKSLNEMRSFLALNNHNQVDCTSTNEPLELVNELAAHCQQKKCSNNKLQRSLNHLLIAMKNGSLSWIKQLLDQQLSTLLDSLCDMVESFNPNEESESVWDHRHQKLKLSVMNISVGIQIIRSLSNTGMGFNKLSSTPSCLSQVMHFVMSTENKLNSFRDRLMNPHILEEIMRIHRTSLDLLTVFLYQNSHVVLSSMSATSKQHNSSKFQFIVDGFMISDSDDLRVRYLNLLYALFACKDFDVYQRIRMHSEFTRLGLFRHIQRLLENSQVSIGENVIDSINRLKMIINVDYPSIDTEFSNLCETSFGDPVGLFVRLRENIQGTLSEKHLTSILHHLMIIHDLQGGIRDSYFGIFDAIISRTIKEKCDGEASSTIQPSQLFWSELVEIISRSSDSTYGGSTTTLEDQYSLSSVSTSGDGASTFSIPLLVNSDQNVEEMSLECSDFDKTVCPAVVSVKCTEIQQIEASPENTNLTDMSDVPIPPPLMEMDSLSSECIYGEEGSILLPPPPPPPAAFGISHSSMIPSFLKPKTKYQVPKGLKKVQWTKLNVQKISKDSVWANLDEEDFANQSFCAALEKEFSTENRSIKHLTPTISSQSDKDKYLKFLDSKTGQNLAILLSFLRASPETVCRWIRDGDEDNLSLNVLQQIRKYAQICLDQRSAITNLSLDSSAESLQPPETFIVLLSQLPLLDKRIDCLIFKRKFTEHSDGLVELMNASIQACRQIVESEEFKIFMGLLLVSGNYLNSSLNNYVCAYGFCFDYLAKVYSTKSSNGRSLLHIVLYYLSKIKGSTSIDRLISLQPISEIASKVDMNEIRYEIQVVKDGITMIQEFIDKSSDDDHDKNICRILEPFLQNVRLHLGDLNANYDRLVQEHKALADYLSFDCKQIDEFFVVFNELLLKIKLCKVELDVAAKEKHHSGKKPSGVDPGKRHRRYSQIAKSKPLNPAVFVNDLELDVVDKVLAAVNSNDRTLLGGGGGSFDQTINI